MLSANKKSSLRRRRGTKSRRAGSGVPTVVVVFLLLGLVGSLTLLWGLFSSLTAEEKRVTVDKMRHKVQAVPNLLRGHNPLPVAHVKSSAGHGPPAVERFRPNGSLGNGDSSNVNDSHAAPDANAAAVAADAASPKAQKPYPYPLDKLATQDEVTSYQPKGGFRFDEYTDGESPYRITDQLRQASDALARSRRVFVKNAMKFAWDGYTKYAFGYDEIKPQSGQGDNAWGGQGITLVDALDTLWIMGMKEEFYHARDWVRDKLDHSRTGFVSLFETTIRDLGGLLSAYDLSHDEAFLHKAQDLGRRLMHGFDNNPSGIPYGQVHLGTGQTKNIAWAGGNAILSEAGTIQIENRYLSKVTNDPQYAEKTEKIFEILHQLNPPNYLYPYYIRNGANKPVFTNNKLTFGAMSDSFYEYMLKVWIQGGKTEPIYRQMYDESIEGMHKELLQVSSPSKLTYIADKNGGRLDHKMDHLVCFMGGLLALGAYTDPLGMDSPRAQRDMKAAKALTYTCYQMYARMATGISAEFVQFEQGRDFQIGRGAPHYLLRPEAVESFYVLNQITGDPVYREWGWEVFLSIEKYCKAAFAYGSISNVQDTNGRPRDKMESFFLAETLKYLYLLQDPDSEIDILTTHVFNTEAHPVRIFPKMTEIS